MVPGTIHSDAKSAAMANRHILGELPGGPDDLGVRRITAARVAENVPWRRVYHGHSATATRQEQPGPRNLGAQPGSRGSFLTEHYRRCSLQASVSGAGEHFEMDHITDDSAPW